MLFIKFKVKKKQFFQNFMTIMLFGAIGTLISFAIISFGNLLLEHWKSAELSLDESVLDERTHRRATLEASLREVLFQIIKFVNEKKDHVPSIPNLESVSFPYEITVSRMKIGQLGFSPHT